MQSVCLRKIVIEIIFNRPYESVVGNSGIAKFQLGQAMNGTLFKKTKCKEDREFDMKKSFGAVVCTAVFLFFQCGNVWGQETGFGLGCGISLVDIEPGHFGNMDNDFSPVAMPELDLTWNFTESLSVELSGGYIKTDMEVSYDSKSGKLGEITQIPIRLTGRYRFPVTKSNVFIHLGAGAGWYLNEFENNESENEGIEEFFGMNVSAQMEDSIGAHLNVGIGVVFWENCGLDLDVTAVFNEPDFELVWPDGETETKAVSMNASLLTLGFTLYF